MDMLKIEKEYWSDGFEKIAGIDEAGRGPLAGPVVAACVVFKKYLNIDGIKDSKKLTKNKRNHLYKIIHENAIDIGVGIVNEDKIDEINILEATFLAFKTAVGSLSVKPDLILVDGPKSNLKHYKVSHVINGDNLSQTIAAASIIAKVTRDRIMEQYSIIFPYYGFEKNNGYGTKLHFLNLAKYKASPIHRKSFKVVRKHIPNIKDISNIYGLNVLGSQLVGTKYIKLLYQLIDANVRIDSLNDIIDFIFLNDNKYLFVKVVTSINNKKKSVGLKDVSDFKVYSKEISNYLQEKDMQNEFLFNVISITLIKNNKPYLKTIFCEENIN